MSPTDTRNVFWDKSHCHRLSSMAAVWAVLRTVVIGPLRMDEQPVGIDAVRRAGDQSHQIPPFLNTQAVYLFRQHRLDIIDPVRQGLFQYMNIENIALRT